jgi:hypothetical protein
LQQESNNTSTKINRKYISEVFRTETEPKIRNEIERKMQDNQPTVEKEK